MAKRHRNRMTRTTRLFQISNGPTNLQDRISDYRLSLRDVNRKEINRSRQPKNPARTLELSIRLRVLFRRFDDRVKAPWRAPAAPMGPAASSAKDDDFEASKRPQVASGAPPWLGPLYVNRDFDSI